MDWYDLLARVAEGDRMAFLRLFGFITNYLRRLAGRSDPAWEDLAQVTANEATRARLENRIKEPHKTKAFIRSIARHKLYDHFGDNPVQQTSVDLDSEPVQEPPIFDDPELAAVIRDAVNRLGEPDRSLLLDKHFFGLTYPEIERKHGSPSGTAKVRIAKALVRVRNSLGEKLE